MDEEAKSDFSRRYNWMNGIAGGALGGFIALLLALSNTPVVASTLTVLLGAATVFLALQDQLPGTKPREISKALLYRIIGFSVVGVIALLIGLQLRSSDVFGESVHVRLYSDLVEIGVDSAEARKIITERLAVPGVAEETERERLSRSTTVFGAGASAPTCDSLEPTRFTNIDSIYARYGTEGGAWAQIAETVRAAVRQNANVDAMNLTSTLHAVHCQGYE